MPCAALLQMRNIVALECPRRISKLSGPVTQDIVNHIPYTVINNSHKQNINTRLKIWVMTLQHLCMTNFVREKKNLTPQIYRSMRKA